MATKAYCVTLSVEVIIDADSRDDATKAIESICGDIECVFVKGSSFGTMKVVGVGCVDELARSNKQ